MISGVVQLLLSFSEFEPWFLPRFPAERFPTPTEFFFPTGSFWPLSSDPTVGSSKTVAKLFFRICFAYFAVIKSSVNIP